jgi:hypothetical protein
VIPNQLSTTTDSRGDAANGGRNRRVRLFLS